MWTFAVRPLAVTTSFNARSMMSLHLLKLGRLHATPTPPWVCHLCLSIVADQNNLLNNLVQIHPPAHSHPVLQIRQKLCHVQTATLASTSSQRSPVDGGTRTHTLSARRAGRSDRVRVSTAQCKRCQAVITHLVRSLVCPQYQMSHTTVILHNAPTTTLLKCLTLLSRRYRRHFLRLKQRIGSSAVAVAVAVVATGRTTVWNKR